MQVFVPYKEPIEVAYCLDEMRLNKQIIECGQILNAIEGKNAWSNHPVVLMYKDHSAWLLRYKQTLECYRDGLFFAAAVTSAHACYYEPGFLTDEFCDQHKRRLFTKDPVHYKRFESFGTSDENWYMVDGILRKYINGKQINKQ